MSQNTHRKWNMTICTEIVLFHRPESDSSIQWKNVLENIMSMYLEMRAKEEKKIRIVLTQVK